MKSVIVPRDAADLHALLAQARGEDILVQTADGSEFIVSLVDDFDREVARSRQNRKLMELLDQRSSSSGARSLNDVRGEIKRGTCDFR